MIASLQRIEPLNVILERDHGLRVQDTDINHLRSVLEHYDAKRRAFIQSMGEAAAFSVKEYQKSYLISEAIRILLREVEPKRRKRKK